jgi:glycosyltransferase involved in cell wall biosynthesis
MTDAAVAAQSFDLSVCVATRNRVDSLLRMLHSLNAAVRDTPRCEIIVVDNGSSDATASALAEWRKATAGRVALSVAQPGKSRALNCALRQARGTVLAFTDDDVEVDPQWPAAVCAFFAAHSQFVAAMGRVRLPRELQTDPGLRALVNQYRTIPVYDRGDNVCELNEMYGANMAVRRDALLAIGGFNEQLGPGVGTASEDLDLAQRLCAAGGRIGYMPGAIVYHEVDHSRLNRAYLADFQKRLGRSELVLYPNRTYWHALPRLAEAAVSYAWASVMGTATRQTRAWGRLVRHADLLRQRWRLRSNR